MQGNPLLREPVLVTGIVFLVLDDIILIYYHMMLMMQDWNDVKHILELC
jgi:hypothetical protein